MVLVFGKNVQHPFVYVVAIFFVSQRKLNILKTSGSDLTKPNNTSKTSLGTGLSESRVTLSAFFVNLVLDHQGLKLFFWYK